MRMPERNDLPPVRPERLSVRFERAGERLSISHWRRAWQRGVLFFAASLFMLAVWGFVIAAIFNDPVPTPKLLVILLGLLGLNLLLIFALAIVPAFAKHDEFVLDEAGAAFVCRVIFPIERRQIPLGEIVGFHAGHPR